MSVRRLGQGRRSVKIEILKAIEDGEGYKGYIVMVEGGRVNETSERIIIDCILWDSQGKIFMPEEELSK